MLDKNNTLEYNYKILTQEREKQKISLENASSQLTLSVDQIKSLENNLSTGFATPHFKSLALKRYAQFLGIDFYKIIPPSDRQQEIITDHEESGESVESVESGESVESVESVESIQNSSLFQPLKLKGKGKGKIIAIVMGLIVLVLGFLFAFAPNENIDEKAPSLEAITSDLNAPKEKYIDSSNVDLGPISEDFINKEKVATISKKDIQEIKNTPITLPIEFICSIESASMDKVWSRVNPEKPPNYFHIVSLKKQSVCFIDNQGVLKQYDLAEGGKITPRGEAPFKIQLNPSISELYFQGWKVYLEENDSFIQLNPVDMAIDLN